MRWNVVPETDLDQPLTGTSITAGQETQGEHDDSESERNAFTWVWSCYV